ncbi:hypothetical protein N0D16_002722 [Salmonella enterica]|nr:hypothetical protein [Salmonella enterica]EJQ1998361.1 hypothetical protein [Salmonella enterica]
MKLTISNITHAENHVKGTAAVELDYLIAPVTLCSFRVSVDCVEGKSLEEYEAEPKEKALDTIRTMHEKLISNSAANISSTWSVRLNENEYIATGNVL